MTFAVSIRGVPLTFDTAPGLFSPAAVDAGTALLLANVQFESDDKVLDLGCGYGVIGIYAAKLIGPQGVYLLDSDPQAIRLARDNAQRNRVEGLHIELSDGFRSFDETGFTKILCNPPYHTDFSVAKHFIEKGFNRLTLGGTLWMVTKRERWYRNKLTSVFGGTRVIQQGAYFTFLSVKKRQHYASSRTK